MKKNEEKLIFAASKGFAEGLRNLGLSTGNLPHILIHDASGAIFDLELSSGFPFKAEGMVLKDGKSNDFLHYVTLETDEETLVEVLKGVESWDLQKSGAESGLKLNLKDSPDTEFNYFRPDPEKDLIQGVLSFPDKKNTMTYRLDLKGADPRDLFSDLKLETRPTYNAAVPLIIIPIAWIILCGITTIINLINSCTDKAIKACGKGNVKDVKAF